MSNFFKRIGNVIRGHANEVLEKAEDPKIVIEQAVRDLESQLRKANGAVQEAYTARNITEDKYNRATAEIKQFTEQAKEAAILSKESENEEDKENAKSISLAFLEKRKVAEMNANIYKEQLESQEESLQKLEEQKSILVTKINEYQAKKNILISKAEIAEATISVNETMSGIEVGGAIDTIKRAEEKVNELDAKARATTEIQDLSPEDKLIKFKQKQEKQDLETEFEKLLDEE